MVKKSANLILDNKKRKAYIKYVGFFLFPDGFKSSISTTSIAIELIFYRVFLIIILMILFGGIKVGVINN